MLNKILLAVIRDWLRRRPGLNKPVFDAVGEQWKADLAAARHKLGWPSDAEMERISHEAELAKWSKVMKETAKTVNAIPPAVQ